MVTFSLEGKNALVTGVTGGIGAAIATALADAGAAVIGVSTGRRSDEDIRRHVESAGRTYRSEHADFSSRDGVHRLSQRVLAGGAVDILVNNAGILHRGPTESHSDEVWDEVIEVDLTAPFILAREFGATMVARGRGAVLFIASMQSFQGRAGLVGYTAAKTGLVGLVRALANEWAASGVNVNAIAPGYIETDMTAPRRADKSAREHVRARIPAGRWGRPNDLGGAAVFLASDAAQYIHGVVLPVDGGWLVR